MLEEPVSLHPTRTAKALRRRTWITGAGALAVVHATTAKLGMPFIGNAAAADPIRIGMIYAKTGAVADQGEYMSQGSALALELQNNTILGRHAELVWLDEPTPQNAQQNAERLIGEQKVIAIVGGSLSSSALAISAVMKTAKLPFVAPNAAAIDLTGRLCNKYTFRVQPPVDAHTRVLAPSCAILGKRWYLITAAFAFGQDIKRSFTEFGAANGCSIVGADEVPLNTADYSSFILKIRAAKPDVVVGGLSGSDLSTFLKQWNELGMKGRIPFAEISVGTTDLWGVGPEAADGLFTLNWYYKNSNNPPEEQAMAASYERKYKRPAADKAWMGWIAMKALLDSIETVKTTEPGAVVGALEHWGVERGGIRAGYRAFDHQFVNSLLVVGIKPTIPDKWDYFDVRAEVPSTLSEIDKVFGTQAQSACKMDAL